MKGCLEEFQDFTVDEIAEKYIEGSPQIAQIAVNLDEGTDSKGEQIEGGKTEDSTMKEGTITYDIRFYALVSQSKETIKLILNVEAQNNFYPGYPIITSRNLNEWDPNRRLTTEYRAGKEIWEKWT